MSKFKTVKKKRQARLELGSDGMYEGGRDSSGFTPWCDEALLRAPREIREAYEAYRHDQYTQAYADGTAPIGMAFDASWRRQMARRPVVMSGVALDRAPLDFVRVGECAQGKRARKVYRMKDGAVSCDDYDIGGYIRSTRVELCDLDDLYGVLSTLQAYPNRWVMRGALRKNRDASRPHRRRSHEEQGLFATYRYTDHHWAMIDIDHVAYPDHVAPGDGDAAAAYIRAMLPACFHDAACIWQWSNSAGVGGWDKIKLHLWFWFDRAVTGESLRPWLRVVAPIVDRAPFNPVQPHYTSAPGFADVVDPLEGLPRLGRLEGGEVKLPLIVDDVKTHQKKQHSLHLRQAKLTKAKREARTARGESERLARGAIKRACEVIQAALDGERHETIRDESYTTYRFVMWGDLEEHVWRDSIKAAAAAVLPLKRLGEVDRLLDGVVKKRGVA